MSIRTRCIVGVILHVTLLSCAESQVDSTIEHWTVELVPAVVIGADESRVGHALHQVVGAVRLSDGRIAIANRGSSEVLIFDRTGDLQHRIGGPGGGPDQIRNVSLLGKLIGDTLIAQASDPAIVTISPEGSVVRKESVPYVWTTMECRSGAGCGSTFLVDGTILFLAAESGVCDLPAPGLFTWTTLVGRYDWRLGAIDTLGILTGPEGIAFRYGSHEGQIAAVGRPYGRVVVASASSDRIFAAATGADSIGVYTFEGQLAHVWASPFPGRAVSPGAKAVHAPAPPREGTIGPTEPYDYPDEYPRLARLLADETDHLWIMKYPEAMEPVGSDRFVCHFEPVVPEGGAEWLVLNSTGRPIAEVRTPPNLFLLEVGADYVLGLSRDSLDVQTVAVHELRR